MHQVAVPQVDLAIQWSAITFVAYEGKPCKQILLHLPAIGLIY
jgi:hypothetical protein